MRVSIFSCTYSPLVYLLWRNVYSSPLPFLRLGYLFSCCCVVDVLYTLDINPLSDIKRRLLRTAKQEDERKVLPARGGKPGSWLLSIFFCAWTDISPPSPAFQKLLGDPQGQWQTSNIHFKEISIWIKGASQHGDVFVYQVCRISDFERWNGTHRLYSATLFLISRGRVACPWSRS